MLTMETTHLMRNQSIDSGSWSEVLKILRGNLTTKSKNLIPLSWAASASESRISDASK